MHAYMYMNKIDVTLKKLIITFFIEYKYIKYETNIIVVYFMRETINWKLLNIHFI